MRDRSYYYKMVELCSFIKDLHTGLSAQYLLIWSPMIQYLMPNMMILVDIDNDTKGMPTYKANYSYFNNLYFASQILHAIW